MKLFTSGPVEMPQVAIAALSQQPLHHRSDEFRAVTQQLWTNLAYAFSTKNPVVAITGSGMTGIEAAMSNTLEAGSTILVVVHGRFGLRMVEIARCYGLQPIVVEHEWGAMVSADRIVSELQKHEEIQALWLVHVETSTGVALPLADIARSVRDVAPNILICVDAVSSIGIQEVLPDEWDLDIVATASQKGLMSPPGLALLMLSKRAMLRMNAVTQRYYTLNLSSIVDGMNSNRFVWTPPVTTVVALAKVLESIREKTLEVVWNDRQKQSEMLKAGLEANGQVLFGVSNAPGLTVVEHSRADILKQVLKEKFGIVVAGGQDKLASKVLRIGTMGCLENSDIEYFLSSFNNAHNEVYGRVLD